MPHQARRFYFYFVCCNRSPTRQGVFIYFYFVCCNRSPTKQGVFYFYFVCCNRSPTGQGVFHFYFVYCIQYFFCVMCVCIFIKLHIPMILVTRCVCVYLLNCTYRAIRGCHPSHSMRRGDQCYLLRKPLIRRDRGDTLYLYNSYLSARVCVFMKLHMAAQSGPVILVVLCHSHLLSQGGINDSYYESTCVGV